MKKKRLFSLISIFVSCGALFSAVSARAQFQVEYWTTDDQLPQNTVSSVLQTRDGYLWLATLDGLARYNGSRFQVFNKANSPGIGSNRFKMLAEDADGNLWAATETSGLTRYRDRRFQTLTVADGLPDNNVVRMFTDAEGLVVVASTGVVRWQGERFVPYSKHHGLGPGSAVHRGPSGALWYTSGGVLRRVEKGAPADFALPAAVVDAKVDELLEDGRGRLWIGANKAGVFVLENGKFAPHRFPDAPREAVVPMLEDRNGNLWFAARDGGVIVSGGGETHFLTVENGLSDNHVSRAYEDSEGSVWLGTYYRGLNRINRQSVVFYSVEDGLTADITHPIYETRAGDVLIGGKNLTRYRAGRFEAFPRDKAVPAAVTAIHEDSRGRLWFGHWNTVYYLENGRHHDFTAKIGVEASFWDIHESADGTLWFASTIGLFSYRDGRVERLTTADGLPSNDVKVIHESTDGTLWAGTAGGLVRLEEVRRGEGEEARRGESEKGRKGGEDRADGPSTSLHPFSPSPLLFSSPSSPRSRRLSVYTVADGLASDLVRAIYEDADGTLWLGSYDGGLTRLKNGKFTAYTSAHGLFNDGVFQILEDRRGNLWMSSNRGVYRVAKRELDEFAEGRRARINSFALGKADGLLETECNGGQQPAGIVARDGRLWFPTQKGVAVIDPEKMRVNDVPPPVVIESFSLDGRESGEIGDLVEVPSDVQNLEIDYAALSFIKPEQVRFRYRMSGLDEDWVETGGRRTAYFSHLPPGEYVFTVIAANADDVWNAEGRKLRVRVVPPFYRTWWFTALAAIFVAGSVLVVYRRRERQFAREKAQQESFSRRLIESQERERERIAAELHDGLSQSLVIIKNRAQLSLAAPADAERAFEQLEEISAAASDAMIEAKEIIHNLRPIQLDRFGLTKAVKAMLKKAGETYGIEFAAAIEAVDGTLSKEAESNLFRILQESVNNIVRHSGAGRARVSISRGERFVTAIVEDDGKGFTIGQNRNGDGGFGLVGIAERARLLDGSAAIESSPGRGTRIVIGLPIAK